MTFASSSVKVLLRKIFFTRKVFPEGRIAPVVGMGGSPSFCCRLSAMTRNTLRPMFILFRDKSFKVKMSDNSSFFMLKTSHQITVRDGRRGIEEKWTSGSTFFKPAQALEFNIKFPSATLSLLRSTGSPVFQLTSKPSHSFLSFTTPTLYLPFYE